ncbi:MAG: ABC transporter substrate-binding protein [Chloroflexi bacterium]|nr:ABC transporter substrate-binding protein [Chloroflexota bacterium]
MASESSYWNDLEKRRLSRRQVLKSASRIGMGLAGISLLGCAAPAAAPTAAPGKTAAPQATTAAVPRPGGTLIVARERTVDLDPDLASGGDFAYHAPNLYNTLTTMDEKGKSIPELAESWETPDATTLVLKLKKGVKFHDGTDFNAQSVKTRYERTLSPETKSRAFADLANLKSQEVVDDYTIKLTSKAPSGSFLYQVTGLRAAAVATGYMPSPEALKKQKDLRTNGVGSGPFQTVDFVMDDHMTFKKFSGYWEKGIPYLDGITWKIVPDPTVRVTMLQTGEIHWANWVDIKDVARIKADPNLEAVVKPVTGAVTLTFNQKRAPFNNAALRQAVLYATDREAISKVIYLGLQAPGDGWLGPHSWAYDPTIKNYPYDLAKAKEKLKEGGKPDGFEFSMLVSPSFPDWVQVAELMQPILEKVGIKMKITMLEWTAASAQYESGAVDAGVIGWTGDADPAPDMRRAQSTKGGTYAAGLLDPNDPIAKEVDALWNKADSLINIEERRAVYVQLQKLLMEKAYYQPVLTYQVSRNAHRKEVKGYVQLPSRFITVFRKVWLEK